MTKSAKTLVKKAPAKKAPARKDGRVAVFTRMLPSTIADMKIAAASEGLKDWQFIERAVIKASKSKRSA